MEPRYNKHWGTGSSLAEFKGGVGRFDIWVVPDGTPTQVRVAWGNRSVYWHWLNAPDSILNGLVELHAKHAINGELPYTVDNLIDPPNADDVAMIQQFVKLFIPEANTDASSP